MIASNFHPSFRMNFLAPLSKYFSQVETKLLIERDGGLEIADIDVDVAPVQTHSHDLILTAC